MIFWWKIGRYCEQSGKWWVCIQNTDKTPRWTLWPPSGKALGPFASIDAAKARHAKLVG